jgi:hypothetical protein
MTRATKGFGGLITMAHGAVARDLGFVLTLADRDSWCGFTTVLRARLAPEERAELARASLLSCDDAQYAQIMIAQEAGAGPPVPAFDDVAAEARQWAEWASRAELNAYAVAAFLRMTKRDRADFIAFGQGRLAA